MRCGQPLAVTTIDCTSPFPVQDKRCPAAATITPTERWLDPSHMVWCSVPHIEKKNCLQHADIVRNEQTTSLGVDSVYKLQTAIPMRTGKHCHRVLLAEGAFAHLGNLRTVSQISKWCVSSRSIQCLQTTDSAHPEGNAAPRGVARHVRCNGLCVCQCQGKEGCHTAGRRRARVDGSRWGGDTGLPQTSRTRLSHRRAPRGDYSPNGVCRSSAWTPWARRGPTSATRPCNAAGQGVAGRPMHAPGGLGRWPAPEQRRTPCLPSQLQRPAHCPKRRREAPLPPPARCPPSGAAPEGTQRRGMSPAGPACTAAPPCQEGLAQALALGAPFLCWATQSPAAAHQPSVRGPCTKPSCAQGVRPPVHSGPPGTALSGEGADPRPLCPTPVKVNGPSRRSENG